MRKNFKKNKKIKETFFASSNNIVNADSPANLNNPRKIKNTSFHRAKKSLGQNFLKSKPVLEKIALVGEIKKTDTILEIGPGKGALTEKLLTKAKKVIAIEKDENLTSVLREKFSKEIKEKRLFLTEGDILDFEASSLVDKYKIVANIPYNITGAILKKFLTEKNQPEMMILLVQLEVAKRIVANDKKESVLSISVKAYGSPRNIQKIPARFFSPVPKVDSAIISISNISRDFFMINNIDEEKFWLLIKDGFAHKRKILAGNLKNYIKDEKVSGKFKRLFENKFKNKRAEDLRLEDWRDLAVLLT